MQNINLDSENSLFDAVNKTYGNLDYLVKFLNDNGGNISNLPLVCIYDDKLNITTPNYAIKLGVNLVPNIVYNKSDNQTEFDIVLNTCYDLNNLAKILNENNTKLGGTNTSFNIQKIYINDIKASNHLSNNRIRFNTGYNLTPVIGGGFILNEDGSYTLQENSDKLIIE